MNENMDTTIATYTVIKSGIASLLFTVTWANTLCEAACNWAEQLYIFSWLCFDSFTVVKKLWIKTVLQPWVKQSTRSHKGMFWTDTVTLPLTLVQLQWYQQQLRRGEVVGHVQSKHCVHCFTMWQQQLCTWYWGIYNLKSVCIILPQWTNVSSKHKTGTDSG